MPRSTGQVHRAPDPKTQSGQSQGSFTLPGTGRSEEGTGKQELSCHAVLHKLCRSEHLRGPQEHLGQCGLGDYLVTQEGSTPGNLAAAIFYFVFIFPL